jgi:hypothetical protein
MRAFVDKLHSSGRKWVPIHDSAVAKVPGYPVYDEGEAAGVWIKDRDGQPYTGQVSLLGCWGRSVCCGRGECIWLQRRDPCQM